jgi:hypothetical protein
MNFKYCYKTCQKGKEASEKFLNENNSAFDAAIDFQYFTDKCFETCQHKAELEKENHKIKVCCISAKARHGKDTAAAMMAEYLEGKGKRVLITHFADLLKFICVKFFGWNGDKDEAGRTLLQRIGTDVIGAKQPEYWAKFIVDILKFFEDEWDYVLIPDTRYPIEISTMKENFDTVVLRVERPCYDNGLTTAQKSHPSEITLDGYRFDDVIYNDSTLEEFERKVKLFADVFLLAN